MILPPEAISAICSYYGVKEERNVENLLIFSEIRTLEQSDVCVINHSSLTSNSHPPRSLFCKQASIERLKKVFSKSEEGWDISFKSFLNEQVFLSDYSSKLSKGTIPRCVYTSKAPDRFSDSHTFLTITEKISSDDYKEYKTLTTTQVKSALSWLAAFHKTFWMRSSFSRLFPHGAWWRKVLRPTVNYKSIPDVFTRLCKSIPSFSKVDTPENYSLIQCVAKNIDVIHNSRPNTLVHGDFKTSNIFFRASDKEVMAIDFQWSGGGNCAADVAYLLAGGVQYEDLNEELLLDHYYNELTSSQDIRDTYSRESFLLSYELELLCYYTTALPYLLKDLTPTICLENLTKYGWLTHEFDERVTLWLTERALLATKNLIKERIITLN